LYVFESTRSSSLRRRDPCWSAVREEKLGSQLTLPDGQGWASNGGFVMSAALHCCTRSNLRTPDQGTRCPSAMSSWRVSALSKLSEVANATSMLSNVYRTNQPSQESQSKRGDVLGGNFCRKRSHFKAAGSRAPWFDLLEDHRHIGASFGSSKRARATILLSG
jgi:hypothetical protein